LRYRIAREGIDTIVGNHLEVGALKFDATETYIVTWNNDFHVDNIVGNATDLRREEGGWITAEVTWSGEKSPEVSKLVDREEVWLTIYATQVEDQRRINAQRVVSSATLRALYLTPGLKSPWTEMEKE
jgi:hypothetical protein